MIILLLWATLFILILQWLVYYLPPVVFLGPSTADTARSPKRRRRAAGKCRRAPLGLCVVCGQIASGVVARRRRVAERRRRLRRRLTCVRTYGRARACVWPRPLVDGGIKKPKFILLSCYFHDDDRDNYVRVWYVPLVARSSYCNIYYNCRGRRGEKNKIIYIRIINLVILLLIERASVIVSLPNTVFIVVTVVLLLTLLRHTTWWAPSCSIADPVDHYNSARARTRRPLSTTVIALGRRRRHRLRDRADVNEKRSNIKKILYEVHIIMVAFWIRKIHRKRLQWRFEKMKTKICLSRWSVPIVSVVYDVRNVHHKNVRTTSTAQYSVVYYALVLYKKCSNLENNINVWLYKNSYL